jgi:Mg2+-importing ATPase
MRAAVVIASMVVLSVGLAFVQEHAFEPGGGGVAGDGDDACDGPADGVAREIPLEEVVAGDVVELAAGDLVPADIRLVAARDLHVDQSALTGEAMPVEKAPGRARPGAGAVRAGGSGVHGQRCRQREGGGGGGGDGGGDAVRAAGADTLEAARPATDFDRGIARFTWLMIRFMAVHGAGGVPDQRLDQGQLAGGAAVRGGRRGRADAGAAADDRDGEPVQGRAARWRASG